VHGSSHNDSSSSPSCRAAGAGYKVSKQGYSTGQLVEAFVTASGQQLDADLVTEQATALGRLPLVSEEADTPVHKWMQPSLRSPEWTTRITTPYFRGV